MVCPQYQIPGTVLAGVYPNYCFQVFACLREQEKERVEKDAVRDE